MDDVFIKRKEDGQTHTEVRDAIGLGSNALKNSERIATPTPCPVHRLVLIGRTREFEEMVPHDGEGDGLAKVMPMLA